MQTPSPFGHFVFKSLLSLSLFNDDIAVQAFKQKCPKIRKEVDLNEDQIINGDESVLFSRALLIGS